MRSQSSFKDRKKLNLAVKQDFQRWMLQQVLVAVGISALVAALILYFYARQEVVGSFFDAHVKIRRVSDMLLPVVIAGSAVSLAAGIVLSLFLPQKIAGPVYRIEKGLEGIASGDLTTSIKLRDEDALQDLAESVNQTTAALRTLISENKAGVQELAQLVEAGALDKASSLLQKQKEALDKFTT